MDCAAIGETLELKCSLRHTYILLFKFTSQVTLYKCCFASATISNQDKLRTEKGRESEQCIWRHLSVILAQILFIPARCCKHKTELPMKQLPVLGTNLLSPSIRL